MNSECTLGRMAACMKDSIKMTKSMALEYTPGPTLNVMQAGGAMANSMDLEYSYRKRDAAN